MREMKDSGVEWIGKIPREWDVIRNKNAFLCSKILVGDKSTHMQLLSLTTKGIRKKDIKNPVGKLPESFDTYQYVKKKNIVMCLFDLDCSAVFSGISPYDGMISPAYKVLECRNNMLARYADYWFRYISDKRTFNHYAKNIRYTLNYNEFADLPLLCISIETQHRIADYLDNKCGKIDAIIAHEQTVIEKLKAYKQSIITEAVTKGLNPHVKMKDSGIEWIGEIPENWNIIKMARIIDKTQNGLTRRDLTESKGQIVLKLKNITATGQIDFSDINRIKLSENEKLQYQLSDNDFLFVRVNGSKSLVGKCAIFQEKNEKIAFNDHIIRVKLTNKCQKKYIHWFLISEAGRRGIELLINTAAGQYTISGQGLREIKISFPPRNEQKCISKYLTNKIIKFESIITKKQSVIDKLTEYKKSLIYEVVTGKKEV